MASGLEHKRRPAGAISENMSTTNAFFSFLKQCNIPHAYDITPQVTQNSDFCHLSEIRDNSIYTAKKSGWPRNMYEIVNIKFKRRF